MPVMDGSHDQQVNGAQRLRRQQIVHDHSDMASGSGSGVGNALCVMCWLYHIRNNV